MYFSYFVVFYWTWHLHNAYPAWRWRSETSSWMKWLIISNHACSSLSVSFGTCTKYMHICHHISWCKLWLNIRQYLTVECAAEVQANINCTSTLSFGDYSYLNIMYLLILNQKTNNKCKPRQLKEGSLYGDQSSYSHQHQPI